MSPDVDVHELQRSLNTFTNRWLSGVAPLRVDGEKGHATNRRIMTVKYYLGYGSDRDSSVTSPFVRRMRHPRDPDYFPKGMIGTGIRRRLAQRRRYLQSRIVGFFTPGVTTYDGRNVAKWMVPYLRYARANGWHGVLTSGWRDPAYSEHLCYVMCGAPTCAGRCAGRSSNHSGSSNPHGALDVTDYYTFGHIMARMPLPAGAPRLFNALGSRDPVHFSASGR